MFGVRERVGACRAGGAHRLVEFDDADEKDERPRKRGQWRLHPRRQRGPGATHGLRQHWSSSRTSTRRAVRTRGAFRALRRAPLWTPLPPSARCARCAEDSDRHRRICVATLCNGMCKVRPCGAAGDAVLGPSGDDTTSTTPQRLTPARREYTHTHSPPPPPKAPCSAAPSAAARRSTGAGTTAAAGDGDRRGLKISFRPTALPFLRRGQRSRAATRSSCRRRAWTGSCGWRSSTR